MKSKLRKGDARPRRGRSSVTERVERDLLGERCLPCDAYYGIQTLRAIENFNISGVPISHYPDLVRGLAMVKLAAARANADVGVLPRSTLRGIEAACQRLIDGECHDAFRVDMFQGGAGTRVAVS